MLEIAIFLAQQIVAGLAYPVDVQRSPYRLPVLEDATAWEGDPALSAVHVEQEFQTFDQVLALICDQYRKLSPMQCCRPLIQTILCLNACKLSV